MDGVLLKLLLVVLVKDYRKLVAVPVWLLVGGFMKP
jgi:hypothetical protein